MSAPTILLTGAAGFVGSHVLRALVHRGAQVTAVVRPGADLSRIEDVVPHVAIVEHDIVAELNPIPSSVGRIDCVVHLAWHARPGSYLDSMANVDHLRASLRLMTALEGRGCRRFVAVGTCVEYDTRPGLLTEEAPLRPLSLHASTKTALYLTAQAWARDRGISFAWPRLFFVYGPGERHGRLVPDVATALLAGLPVDTTFGEQVRDYLHVEDMADAYARVALSNLEGAINIGSGHPVVVRDVIAKLAAIIGRPELIRWGAKPPRAYDPPFVCADPSRLRRELGWVPRISLDEGLATTVHWWQRRGSTAAVGRR